MGIDREAGMVEAGSGGNEENAFGARLRRDGR
jgi:hypothetical protein